MERSEVQTRKWKQGGVRGGAVTLSSALVTLGGGKEVGHNEINTGWRAAWKAGPDS